MEDERTANETTFTDSEKAAMRERAKELKKAKSRPRGKKNGEADLLAKVNDLSPEERAMAMRVHELIKASGPQLEPRTWYGMPAYSLGGKVVCFYQPASKFGARYATLGFNDSANLDSGAMWPTAFALRELTAEAETAIAELVRRAVS